MCPVRRRQLLIASGALLVAPLASFAQKRTKVWRIAFLTSSKPVSNPSEPDPYGAAFVGEMQAAGFSFGVDYVIEVSSADDDYEHLPALANELVLRNVDIIIPVTLPAIIAAHKASKAVPMVFIAAHDPVGMGLVASLARPGGNLTGVATFYGDLIPKHLELLKSMLPKASRVAILANASLARMIPGAEQSIRDAGLKLGMHLQIVPIDSAAELPQAFVSMTRERAGAFIALADVMFLRERRQVAELAQKNRLPSFFASRENVQAGGLVSYGEDAVEMFAQAAKYVSKMMKGAKPGDLPIEQPTKFHLAINRRTAAALKLTIPQELLLRADTVIE